MDFLTVDMEINNFLRPGYSAQGKSVQLLSLAVNVNINTYKKEHTYVRKEM